MRKLLTLIILLNVAFVQAQVKIGDNPNTINANSLLEMESTNKGFLPPRVALSSLTSVSPLSGTVPAGMMVYSSGGSVADGFYFWDGTKWATLAHTQMVTKSADATLLKTETFVLASGDITLTLPTVTSADNGLTITVKHIGTHTDQVVVATTGGATQDGVTTSNLYRWISRSFVAYNGNWIQKNRESKTNNLFEVNSRGSWTTITEILEFLDLHMSGPSVVRLSGETYDIDATQVIDLNYPLTIEGMSYGTTTIASAPGLAGSPMFRCLSETYFKHLAFDGSALSSSAGEDAIQLEGADEYYEIKDCSFDEFNKAIVAETNIELWLFETDMTNTAAAGLEIAAGVTSGVKVTASECDFNACAKGINLASGVSATTNIVNCTFYNANSGDIGINYIPANFTNFNALFITNNAWNNVGAFFDGFDFSRTDGRDAKAFIQHNAGDGDKNPNCHINVLNSAATTTLGTTGTWYKAEWNHAVTTYTTTKWTISNASGAGNVNRITYQPTHRRGGWFIISGNLTVNNANRTISLGVVKNANAAVRFGETTIRTQAQNTSALFSTVVYIADIAATDYFEIWCSTSHGGDVVTFQDVQWLAETK